MIDHPIIIYADFTGLVWLLFTAAFNAGITIPVTGAALLTLVNTTAALVASGLAAGAAALLAPKPEMPKPSDGQLTVKQAVPTRRRGYGRVKIGGVYAFVDQVGPLLFVVVLLHSGEIDAFEEDWFDDKEVEFDGNGNVITAPWLLFGVPWVSFARRLGTDDQTAFDEFDFQTYFPAAWTSDHRNLGSACVLMRSSSGVDVQYFQNVFETGTAPAYRTVARLSKVYDPRKDSTVPGGSGSHRANNKATWEWSENPALCILDFLTHSDGWGLPRTWWSNAAYAEWMAAANICEEAVALKEGGTQARYTLGGTYELTVPPKQPLRAMLATCDGWLYMRTDNTIGIKVGKYTTPTITLDQSCIRSYQMSSGAGALAEFNSLVGLYNSPDHDWQEQQADPWVDQPLIDAYGEDREDLQLYWVTHHARARRLMKRHFLRSNAQWRGTIVTDLRGLRALGERFIYLTIPALGISAQSFEVVGHSLDVSTMSCRIEVISIGAEIDEWDPDTEEGEAPAIPPVIDTTVDADAQAIIDEMSTPPDQIRELRINNLVVSLKAYGVWQRLDQFYVMAAHDLIAARINWKSPTNDFSLVNAPTFFANRGYEGNGTDAYIDTGVAMDALGGYAQNDACMFAYSLTNANGAYGDVGTDGSATERLVLRNGGSLAARANAPGGDSAPVDDSLGLGGWSRANGTTYKIFKDGVVLSEPARSSAAVSSDTLCCLRGDTLYSPRRIAVFGAGRSLTNAQITALNDAVRNYLSAVGAIT